MTASSYLLLLAVWVAGPCDAWQVSNRVVIEYGALAVDHSETVRQITRRQGGIGGGADLGLFQNQIKTELVFDQTDLKTRRLAMTTRITTRPVIHIAREFPEGSCAYQVVLGHELTHQRFDLEVLRAMPEQIHVITKTLFASDALDWAGTIKLDRARNRFYLDSRYAYDALSLARHQTIDNPASYRRLSALCNGEITRLAGR